MYNIMEHNSDRHLKKRSCYYWQEEWIKDSTYQVHWNRIGLITIFFRTNTVRNYTPIPISRITTSRTDSQREALERLLGLPRLTRV